MSEQKLTLPWRKASEVAPEEGAHVVALRLGLGGIVNPLAHFREGDVHPVTIRQRSFPHAKTVKDWDYWIYFHELPKPQ
ncbi:MAG: hypothetical protein HRU12_03980 [Phaeodactylibacter sp.]|nr:hypothetical protein [Phaeodactylibacter sp.]